MEMSATLNEVYQYYLNTGNIYRKRNMIEKREAPSIIYRAGYAWVMGGKFAYKDCEKFNIIDDTWEPFASLNLGRYSASACVADDSIYIGGGNPLE